MKEYIPRAKTALLILLGIAVVYFSSIVATSFRVSHIEDVTRSQIQKQFLLLSDIARITTDNNADEITNAIIKDCSGGERDRFYHLLSDLNNGLARQELLELDNLFGRCADYHAVRKSVMVIRMEREIAVYKDLIDILTAIDPSDDNEQYTLSTWSELVAAEREQSELYARLVNLQGQIIMALLAGRARDSDQITEILDEVTGVQESLNEARVRSLAIRKELLAS